MRPRSKLVTWLGVLLFMCGFVADGEELAAGTGLNSGTNIVLSLEGMTNLVYTLQWTADSGSTYRVEVASDGLGPWSRAPAGIDPEEQHEQVAPADGVMRYFDTQAAPHIRSVYRVLIPGDDMVLIPAGSFQMGDTFNEGDSDERPVHAEFVSEYEIGKYEVTNQEVADVFNWAIAQGGMVTVSSSSLGGSGNSQEYVDLDHGDCQISWDGSRLVADAGKADYPCVEISWSGSAGFCNAD